MHSANGDLIRKNPELCIDKGCHQQGTEKNEEEKTADEPTVEFKMESPGHQSAEDTSEELYKGVAY